MMQFQKEAIEAKQTFIIDTFKPDDAEGVKKLFESVYGYEYPVKLVYDPDQLIKAFIDLENIPVVARTPQGDVVAYEAMYRSCPNPQVYEAGQGLVLPSYRKQNIINEINRYICEVLAPRMNIDAIFGEAVCNNIYMQKSWHQYARDITSIEIDLMSAEAYMKEKSASGRVACLHMFRIYNLKAHSIYVPPAYRDILEFIYAQLIEVRPMVTSDSAPDNRISTMIKTQIFDFAKVARFAVYEAGKDFSETSIRQEKDALDRGAIVLQVWLNLSWPWINWVVDFLRKNGYFLGGILPLWFGSDGLLMQKIMVQPNWEGICLFNDCAEKILEFAKSDWSLSISAGRENNR